MKKYNFKIVVGSLVLGSAMFLNSCTKDLLDQDPTTNMDASQFWKTETDATIALMGAYSSVRPCFDRDYYYDGQGEYVRTRGTSTSGGTAYNGGDYNPSGYGDNFDNMFEALYGAVNTTNYVVENVNRMLATAKPNSVANLESIIGEARLLRGLVYFRLISMWGDVPYFSKIIRDNEEVAHISRTPIAQIKDSILADLTYAAEKLPAKAVQFGRVGKPAALALRGKVQLYWASWNKNGWPELEGFQASAAEADSAYARAARDFKEVINNFGLDLYMNGEPGKIDELGKANVLPNYYYLFTPAGSNDPGNKEFIMVFTHGGAGTGQGEELMRDVSGRSHEGSQCWVHPRYEIADRYQLTTTGDFAPKLVPKNPKDKDARTMVNSALNPQSYANRDYRMKSSIMWDYEMSIGSVNKKSTGFVPFIYKSWNTNITIDGVNYITYNTDGINSGYAFRKFLRNTTGLGRSEGDFAWPVIRLADVFLMYAEATNEILGPQADAIALVNRIRHRGNLPALDASKTASKESFFAAIEQERIVELLGEGQRSFDLRRWRALERVWCAPYNSDGVWRIDTQGSNQQRYYQNYSERTYQQNYIFRIPPGERDRNSNLSQNTPWL